MTPKRQPPRSLAGIALGANLGDPVNQCLMALKKIEQTPDIKILKVSSFYETAPHKSEEQKNVLIPKYINAVCLIQTQLLPDELLSCLLLVEQALGRKRLEKWAPRTIDLDLLFYDKLILNSPELIIPHPQMHCRAFVLAPLQEIFPEWQHPVISESLEEMIQKNPDLSIQRLPSSIFSAFKD